MDNFKNTLIIIKILINRCNYENFNPNDLFLKLFI